jgi:polyisoprenoid-binding protein YceI
MTSVAVRAIAAMLTAALAVAAHAEPTAYRIDSAHTRAEFEIEHLGVLRAHGRFVNVSGRLVLDPAAHSGTIELDIPVASVKTGWDTRDRFLRGATMFDASHFPRMRFRSTRFEFEAGRLVRVDGELTVRDVTRPVSLVVQRMECDEGCTAEASGAIRRREFAMESWWPLIGDEVELRFHLTAVRE